MGPCPWFMLVWWGKGGMPVSWGCKWDLSIPTKSQMRETSEELHWQCSSTERVPHNTSLVSQALLQVWGATAAGGGWVQLGQQ